MDDEIMDKSKQEWNLTMLGQMTLEDESIPTFISMMKVINHINGGAIPFCMQDDGIASEITDSRRACKIEVKFSASGFLDFQSFQQDSKTVLIDGNMLLKFLEKVSKKDTLHIGVSMQGIILKYRQEHKNYRMRVYTIGNEEDQTFTDEERAVLEEERVIEELKALEKQEVNTHTDPFDTSSEVISTITNISLEELNRDLRGFKNPEKYRVMLIYDKLFIYDETGEIEMESEYDWELNGNQPAGSEYNLMYLYDFLRKLPIRTAKSKKKLSDLDLIQSEIAFTSDNTLIFTVEKNGSWIMRLWVLPIIEEEEEEGEVEKGEVEKGEVEKEENQEEDLLTDEERAVLEEEGGRNIPPPSCFGKCWISDSTACIECEWNEDCRGK